MKSFKDYLSNTNNINHNENLSESPFLYRIYDNGIIYGEMQDFYFYVPKNDEFKKVSYFKPGKKLGLEISRKGAEELFRKKTGYGLVETDIDNNINEEVNYKELEKTAEEKLNKEADYKELEKITDFIGWFVKDSNTDKLFSQRATIFSILKMAALYEICDDEKFKKSFLDTIKRNESDYKKFKNFLKQLKNDIKEVEDCTQKLEKLVASKTGLRI